MNINYIEHIKPKTISITTPLLVTLNFAVCSIAELLTEQRIFRLSWKKAKNSLENLNDLKTPADIRMPQSKL